LAGVAKRRASTATAIIAVYRTLRQFEGLDYLLHAMLRTIVGRPLGSSLLRPH
jgi:hypothetical protein